MLLFSVQMARFEQEAELEYANTVEDGNSSSNGATMLVSGVGFHITSWGKNEPTPAFQESTLQTMDLDQFSLGMSPRRRPHNDQATILPPIYGASASNQIQPLAALAYSQIERRESSQSAASATFPDRSPQQNSLTLPQIQVTASKSTIRFPTPSTGAAVNNRADTLTDSGRENCPKCEMFKSVIVCICETFSSLKNNPRTFPRMLASPTTSCRQRGYSC